MMKLTNRGKNFLVGALLLILSTYYVNSSMFYHQHTIDGETIFHSHFSLGSDASDSEDGGHNLDMAKLIMALNNIVIEQQNFDSHIAPVKLTLEYEALIRPTAQATFYIARSRSLRAPPVYNTI